MSENTASNATASAQAGAVEQDILLDVQHLTKRFAADTNFFGKATSYVQAVDDVSFQIRKGEAFGLVGESGCGKTTVGKMLVNLLKPTSGKIVFDGKELTAMKPAERKQYCKDIQLIFPTRRSTRACASATSSPSPSSRTTSCRKTRWRIA